MPSHTPAKRARNAARARRLAASTTPRRPVVRKKVSTKKTRK